MKKVHFAENYILNPYHQVTVNVIGAGGTGSQVVTALARMDYALRELGHKGLHVTVFDDDVVTEANLGRQLFTPLEVGGSKAGALVTRINRFFGLGWDSVSSRYPSKDADEVANITITCVDNAKARIAIGKHIREAERGSDDKQLAYYWLDFGNATDTGQVVLGTVFPVKQPKSKEFETVDELLCVDQLFDLDSVNDADSGPSCSLAEALRKQDLFINSALSQVGCDILWQLFSKGKVEQNGLFLNLRTSRMNPINIK